MDNLLQLISEFRQVGRYKENWKKKIDFKQGKLKKENWF